MVRSPSVLRSLALAAGALSLVRAPAPAQRAGASSQTLVRMVARRGCGIRPARSYAFPVFGSAGGWAMRNRVTTAAAQVVSTLRLSYGDAPRHGTAGAERPPAGTWSVDGGGGPCPEGHGTVEMAVLQPGTDGGAPRFELRGRASLIRREGEPDLRDAADVRFVGTCGRHQPMVMEIYPVLGRDPALAGLQPRPERYLLKGDVDCRPGAGADAGPTPLAGP